MRQIIKGVCQCNKYLCIIDKIEKQLIRSTRLSSNRIQINQNIEIICLDNIKYLESKIDNKDLKIYINSKHNLNLIKKILENHIDNV